jgi:hypothetical protein
MGDGPVCRPYPVSSRYPFFVWIFGENSTTRMDFLILLCFPGCKCFFVRFEGFEFRLI